MKTSRLSSRLLAGAGLLILAFPFIAPRAESDAPAPRAETTQIAPASGIRSWVERLLSRRSDDTAQELIIRERKDEPHAMASLRQKPNTPHAEAAGATRLVVGHDESLVVKSEGTR